MKHTSHYLAALTAAALLLTPALSYSADAAAGNVPFITGGIGDDEKDQLEMARHSYNLHILSTEGGHYLADIAITITDKNGSQVLSANAGPLFYARLPSGKYTVSASNAGVVKTKTVNLSTKAGAAKIHFMW
jgi:hypothetical protein